MNICLRSWWTWITFINNTITSCTLGKCHGNMWLCFHGNNIELMIIFCKIITITLLNVYTWCVIKWLPWKCLVMLSWQPHSNTHSYLCTPFITVYTIINSVVYNPCSLLTMNIRVIDLNLFVATFHSSPVIFILCYLLWFLSSNYHFRDLSDQLEYFLHGQQ